MKKKYVNLKMQVVDVQLSDCIAGSAVGITESYSSLSERDFTGTKIGSIQFNEWK